MQPKLLALSKACIQYPINAMVIPEINFLLFAMTIIEAHFVKWMRLYMTYILEY